MAEFILNNGDTIGALLLWFALAVWAFATRSWAVLQLAAYKLMLSAERLMETEEGAEKMAMVFAAVWARIPNWLKRFVSEKTLRDMLQDWYTIAKNSLGDERGDSATVPATKS